MSINEIASKVEVFAVYVTAYVVFIMGLIIVWTWILDWLLVKFMRSIKMYGIAVDFIFHRKEFKKWRNANK